jgi:hypothetical protein
MIQKLTDREGNHRFFRIWLQSEVLDNTTNWIVRVLRCVRRNNLPLVSYPRRRHGDASDRRLSTGFDRQLLNVANFKRSANN